MRRLHWFTGACLLITCFVSFSISTLVLHKRSKSNGGFVGVAKKINGVMDVVVPPMVVSPGQVACLLAYIVVIVLWGYGEYIFLNRPQVHARLEGEDPEEGVGIVEAAPLGKGSSSPSAIAEVEHSSIAGGAFARCLQLDPKALRENRDTLWTLVEFGTIMLWYYVADRTTVFNETAKSYSRDVLAFIFLGLTLVAGATSVTKAKVPSLLNRHQTEEWKGWMQVLFLLYHYFEAKEVYNAIRVFIAGYVWMTGYGNFHYYFKTNDFSFTRFCAMMWRLNFLVFFACVVLQNSYMLYYICPMHTIFTIFVYATLGIASKYNKSITGVLLKIGAATLFIFIFWDLKSVFYTIWTPFMWLMGYTDPRRPNEDRLYEWYFRSSLDRYIWIHGMLCAFLHPYAEALLQRIDAMAWKTRVSVRTGITLVTLGIFYMWYTMVYCLPKIEYNKIHPYTSWIPITLWIILRNMTPTMRTNSLALYGWLGCITLETYISQFHTWLSTGIPDGQPKMLLAFFPAEYPLMNFAAATAVYVYVSYRLFHLSNDLKSIAIPSRASRNVLWRNFFIITTSAAGLYAVSVLVLLVGGWGKFGAVSGGIVQLTKLGATDPR